MGLVLAGCQSNSASAPSHYFGYVEAAAIGGEGQPVVGQSLETIGLRIGPGLGIGYFDETRIAFERDCRLVILVPSEAALERVLEQLKHWEPGELCVSATNLSRR